MFAMQHNEIPHIIKWSNKQNVNLIQLCIVNKCRQQWQRVKKGWGIGA